MSHDLDAIRSIFKDEIATLREDIATTNTQIEAIRSSIDDKVNTIQSNVKRQNERIDRLEAYSAKDNSRIAKLDERINELQQSQLRNNIRLTGLPPKAYADTKATAMSIFGLLQLRIIPSDFDAYADSKKSSMIIAFANYLHKRQVMQSLRDRKQLLVEEVIKGVKTDAKVYCNDQLSPYYAKLFQRAWRAKVDKVIYSASSLGGRIKIKRTKECEAKIVRTDFELDLIIGGVTPLESNMNSSDGSSDSPQSNQTTDLQSVLSPSGALTGNTASNRTSDSSQLPNTNDTGHSRSSNQSNHSSQSHHTNQSNHTENQIPLLYREQRRSDSNYTRSNNRFKHQDTERDLRYSPPSDCDNYNNSTNAKGKRQHNKSNHHWKNRYRMN